MYTTLAFHTGAVKEEHKYLQVHPFKDGYAVEEKGIYFDKYQCRKAQLKRFAKDDTLMGVHILGVGEKSEIILRQ